MEKEVETPALESPKPKRNIWKWIVLTLIALVVIGLAWAGFFIYLGFKDKGIVKPLLVEYIQDIADGKSDTAYNDLSSTEMKSVISYSDFQQAIEAMTCSYAGFQSIDLSGFNIQATSDGTFYVYTGTVTYSNGDEAGITATFQKDNGQFKVTGVRIDVTPQRFQTICTQGQSSSTAQ